MGRLKAIGSRLTAAPGLLPPSVLTGENGERKRDAVVSWRQWYKTSRWQKLRWSVLVRDQFRCQMKGCGKIETNTSLLVADHKRQHHGDPVLFWDINNLQCLCKACHDGAKQRAERQRAGRHR
ncbi:hypothetical protein TM49_01625 [Martelella endophytica]|uniref:HNH nuclease domain-containing protein n=2 Tax=Martelella endophytica TaxID=1486262 RepID=A0A0D5LKF0_MAREN|nr:hypothetical protein TM49_01625 [Martelella endophytica]